MNEQSGFTAALFFVGFFGSFFVFVCFLGEILNTLRQLCCCCCRRRVQQVVVDVLPITTATRNENLQETSYQQETNKKIIIERDLIVKIWTNDNYSTSTVDVENSENSKKDESEEEEEGAGSDDDDDDPENQSLPIEESDADTSTTTNNDKMIEIEVDDIVGVGGGGDECCSICLDSFKDGCSVSQSNNTSCIHMFHCDCIATWLLTHDCCPCCRVNYLRS